MSDLAGEYRDLLVKYLAGEVDSALAAAYDASSRAAADGMSLTEFQSALRSAIENVQATTTVPEEVWQSGPMQTFANRCLAAFDRTYGGLRQVESNYQRLFEGHPEPMWVYDLETLEFLDVNDAAVERYGYSRDEFLAMTVKDIIQPDEISSLLEAVSTNQTLEQSGGRIHRAKDGSLFDVEITSNGVTFGNRPARFVMVRDVTERHRLEQQLRQSQRLESLGQLAGGVAHDFNNLLGVILNFALFLKENLTSASREHDGDRWLPAIRDADRIVHAAESASRLTHQLLAFARREVIQPKALNVNSIVLELEPLLRRTLGEHIEFETEAGDGLWPVLMDPGHLEQVLTNLAVNARDAMKQGGKLVIDTKNVTVDETYTMGRPGLKPGRYVRLRVSDTGIGMNQETLQRVFEPFFTTKPKGEGTGLGLATVYGIINQAGGYISIYSEPGLGTRVHALLPATDQMPESIASPTSPVRTTAAETVLVVEDAEDLREVVERILSRNGYHVIVAANGVLALDAATAYGGKIDLLLTDVVMPLMQGKELADRMTQKNPNLKVLFMSGYAEPMLGESGTLDPGVVLMEKPFTEPVLLAHVRKVLEAGR
jgi:PAS domain S-box-containing protein